MRCALRDILVTYILCLHRHALCLVLIMSAPLSPGPLHS